MAEILAHQHLDALPQVAVRPDEHPGQPFLLLVREDVHVPPGLDVQEAPGPQQELLGLLEPFTRAVRSPREDVTPKRPQQPDRADVAEGTRRVLQVRLELIERVVEPRVPLVHQLQQRPRERALLQFATGVHTGEHAVEEPDVANQEAQVAQRELELRIRVVVQSRVRTARRRAVRPSA